ncbi:hypothetical protein XU18_4301 [Perkinsela sp. CCAP 1560/4]|nr:hypothetical protein XU18_4301 [Perkinsela sp. CCAP 1560/4]|eukprot:KNH04442.1 hypothetical protein XU18_4301 [Perkinsela sp. CCAP 1560/4]
MKAGWNHCMRWRNPEIWPSTAFPTKLSHSLASSIAHLTTAVLSDSTTNWNLPTLIELSDYTRCNNPIKTHINGFRGKTIVKNPKSANLTHTEYHVLSKKSYCLSSCRENENTT